MSITLVLDLSSPGELWFTAETLLNALRSRIDSVITEARVKDPSIKDALKKAASERIGPDHPVCVSKPMDLRFRRSATCS